MSDNGKVQLPELDGTAEAMPPVDPTAITDGGVVLERGAIAAKIDDMVGRYIASRRGS